MTPLTNLLVESREDFLDCSGYRCRCEVVEKHGIITESSLDSLVRKAYLLGLEEAKKCVPSQMPYPSEPDPVWLGGWNSATSHVKKALDSAIGEVAE